MAFNQESILGVVEDFRRRKIAFPRKRQIELLQDLLSLVESGVPVLRAFQLFSGIYEGGTKEVCISVIKAINDGKSLADGLTGWLPPEVIVAIRVGEQKGVLAETLKNAAEYLEASKSGLMLFINKSVYPIALTLMAFAMAATVESSFYKTMLRIKEFNEWPELSQSIYNFWSFNLSYWPLLLIGFAAISVFINAQLGSLVGDVRKLLDKGPIFKQYRLQQGASFLKTLGLLLQNGTALNVALTELERSATPYIGGHLRQMKRKVAKGTGNEGDVLNTGLLEDQTINRLKALAEVDDFEIAMVRMGEQTLEMTAQRLEAAAKLGSGLMTAVSGFLIMSVFAGAFELSQSLS